MPHSINHFLFLFPYYSFFTYKNTTAISHRCSYYFHSAMFTFYFLLASEQIPALIASLIHVQVFSPYSGWDFLFRSRSGFIPFSNGFEYGSRSMDRSFPVSQFVRIILRTFPTISPLHIFIFTVSNGVCL